MVDTRKYGRGSNYLVRGRRYTGRPSFTIVGNTRVVFTFASRAETVDSF